MKNIKIKRVTYELNTQIVECCGHYSPKFWNDAITNDFSWKEFSRECTNAVSFGSLCPVCFAHYKKFGLLLNGESEEREWMDGKLPYITCPYCGEEIELDYINGRATFECKSCGCAETEDSVVLANPWGIEG